MKKIALAALAFSALATPAFAGPYVKGSVEFTGNNGAYQNRELQARVGYDRTFGKLTPYVELGGGSNTPDGGDGKRAFVAEVGTSFQATEKLAFNAYYEQKNHKDVDDPEWKVNVGTIYRF